jgi:hypothetical protein
MLNDEDFNLLLSRIRYPDSLKLQLDAFQTHLREVDLLIKSISVSSPTELESYRLIRKLVKEKIEKLKVQISALE